MQGIRARSIFVSAVLALGCGGCVTGSLITIGTVLGALGSAASTGSDVYKLGKLDATLNVNAAECHRAVLKSASDLGLQVVIDEQTGLKDAVWEMTLHDDLKTPVGVRIERRTDRMCGCRVDVGIFGSEPTAHLFMERIRANLHIAPESPGEPSGSAAGRMPGDNIARFTPSPTWRKV